MPGREGIEIAAAPTATRPIERATGALPTAIARVLSPRLIPLALAAVTVVVFLPALWNGFVEWDDQINLYENPEFRGLTWPQIRWMFTTVLMGHWIPLTWLTFGLDFVVWGMRPLGYHLTSLVVFALNAPAFYFMALRVLRLATGFTEGTLRLSAAVATLFFAIHPMRAESVGWATERRDVLSGLFFLLTILVYLKAQDTNGTRRRWLLAGSVGLYVLALVSKASVMVLPFALIVLDVYPLRRLSLRLWEWVSPAARAVWLEKIPFLLLGAAGAAITYYAQNANMFITTLERYPLSARPAMVFYSLWFYLEKTVVPRGLTPLYELPAKVRLFDLEFLLPAIGVIVLTIALVAVRRRWPAGLAVWIYYAIALGPVIGIVHSGHQLTNDRYSYLPTIGFALLLGAAAGAIARAGATGLSRPWLVKTVGGLGLVGFCGLGYLSFHQVQIWRDTESLWRYALEADPDCAICHGNLGVWLASTQRNFAAAMAEYEKVRELRPDNVKVHQHIGYIYAVRGEFPRAIEEFRIYLMRYGNDVDALNNLSAALLSEHRAHDAFAPLQHAIKVKPRHVLSHVNLGYAYADTGDLPRAKQAFQDAIALKYDTPQAWFGLVRVNLEPGSMQAAHTAWGILGQLDPALAGRLGPVFITTW